jgi:hypothetical protein
VAALHVYATPINQAGRYTTLADVTAWPGPHAVAAAMRGPHQDGPGRRRHLIIFTRACFSPTIRPAFSLVTLP